MAIHVIACVLPVSVSGHSHDIPVVAVGADTAQETDEIPVILSIHQNADRAVLLSTALTALEEIPVSDEWTMAVDQHSRRVRVALLLDPIPADIPATFEAFAEMLGVDVPPWAGMLLTARLATRDVPVTSGEDLLMTALLDVCGTALGSGLEGDGGDTRLSAPPRH